MENSSGLQEETGKKDPKAKPRDIKYWTHEEHNRFINGVEEHKKDWIKVSEVVGTRTASQIQRHA